MDTRDPVRRILRTGVWGVPVSTGLLALGTLTHQPDPGEDFAAYAGYVTTPVFLVSHLGASILGAAVGIVGLVSLGVLVAEQGRRPGRTLLGGDERPVNADDALQLLVSSLRRTGAQVERTAAGYRLVVDPDDVDAFRFERLVRGAQAAPDPAERARLAGEEDLDALLARLP